MAHLLDRLLWTPRRRGAAGRERVHYGSLDVEDLGRVYEALLELEPGISSERMCRLRRSKLEVVVPVAQGDKYRPAVAPAVTEEIGEALEGMEDAEPEPEEEEAEGRSKKTKVEWIEEIPPGRFFLRVGLGRKASGSYYTPHSFVRFLVKETLGPQVEKRSPADDPQPGEILRLKVLDPAMGSGHFLIEACRFLGDKLYEACRLCDERALESERRAEKAKADAERQEALGQAAAYRQRVLDLPDPEDEIVRYLPSHAPEGEESGLSQKKAEALCRRLVAVHCLYGVDKNPLAVELAKLALWLESHAEGLPLTFLDHRLVLGDSLTGPFFEHLLKYPGSQQPMDDLFTQGLQESLTKALTQALRQVRDLEAGVGVSLAEVEAKRAAKARLEEALAPFKLVAAAWAGGVMLGPEACDDEAYARLVRDVAETGDLPNLEAESGLQPMIARGLGMDMANAGGATWREMLASADCIPALPYELAFPEVFYPQGDATRRQGFDAVLGNPPWEGIDTSNKEFFASFDFSILDIATDAQFRSLISRLLADPLIQQRRTAYEEDINALKNTSRALLEYVNLGRERASAATPDMYQCFAERSSQLVKHEGYVGLVLPYAFHANESATGLRRLYLNEMGLRCCFSFENRRQLFEIHRSFKFALIIAFRRGPTTTFPCAFYLHDDDWLFGDRGNRELSYSLDFVRRTGGEYLNFLELTTLNDLEVAEVCFAHGKSFGEVCQQSGLRFGRELHMTDDAWRFTPTGRILPGGEDPRDPEVSRRVLDMGYLVLQEGKSFSHYNDHWEHRPGSLVSLESVRKKSDWIKASRYFRAVYRAVARSTDDRTTFFNILPPGSLCGHSVTPERAPWSVPRHNALLIVGIANTFPFDWTVRLRAAANISKFILFSCFIPNIYGVGRFLRSQPLRLVANHAGYEPLWREQLGDIWREPNPSYTWPVLNGDDERWAVRAAIDVVVAQAYDLNREQYAHVLSTFSHRSYPRAPELCLARFDELQAIGLEAFTHKYDPYWDIPLNENLPEPVIDLPLPEQPEEERTPARRQNHLFATPGEFDRETYELIKLLLEDKGAITSADARDLTGLDAAALRPYFHKLTADGLAATEGRGRGVKYRRPGTPS